jgi:DNA-binding NarL/FixJ family response regulator
MIKRILLVEDHPVYADGLRALLDVLSVPVVTTTVASIAGATKQVSEQTFDLILLDLSLSDGSAHMFLNTIKPGPAFTPIVIISGSDDRQSIKQALSLGACGYLSKEASTEALRQALTEFLIDGEHYSPDDKQPGHATARQSAVLTYIAEGLSNKDIALAMCISENTVKYHVKVIYGLLAVKNRTDCLRQAHMKGWID